MKAEIHAMTNGWRLELVDDSEEQPLDDPRAAPAIAQAIDNLAGVGNRITCIKLVRGRTKAENLTREVPIQYKVADYRKRSLTISQPGKLTIATSHYIGTYQTTVMEGQSKKTVILDVGPRFGSAIFNYLLSFASEIFVPPEASSAIPTEHRGYAYWLMILLWRAAFDRALSINHIPRSYVERRENLRTVRGRILLTPHLRKNVVDQSFVYCRYRHLTFNNTLNKTVRHVYGLLNKHGGKALLADVAAYDMKLASLGVSDLPVHPEEIRKIVYTPMNNSYRLLMELSEKIIKGLAPSTVGRDGAMEGLSFFLDVAELWENYIYRLLKRNLPEQYRIVSPNFEGPNYHLIKGDFREIRPDILIWKDDRIVAVIDAKYKRYEKLGPTEKHWGAVSREDLYQLATYLWHFRMRYGKKEHGILGLFVSPKEIASEKEIARPDVKEFTADQTIKIGLANVCLPYPFTEDTPRTKFSSADSVDQARRYSKIFTDQIKEQLDLMCPVNE